MTEPLTVAAAQRRLLEAIAEFPDVPGLTRVGPGDGLEVLAAGICEGAELILVDDPSTARVYACLAELVMAAREDRRRAVGRR